MRILKNNAATIERKSIMPKVLLAFRPGELSDQNIAEIERISPGYELLHTVDRAEIEESLDQIEIAARFLPPELAAQAPNLKWFQQWPVGADWLMGQPEAVEHPFVLTNGRGIQSDCICEHVFALLLFQARQFDQTYPAQQMGQWRNQWTPERMGTFFELSGKTMVVIGLGAIGSRVVAVAKAFKMKVIGVRRRLELPAPGVDRLVGVTQLDEVLPLADFVVLSLPLTHQTLGLIDEVQLRLMKPSTILVNISRGPIIHEGKLVQALQEGWIAGAGLDTFEREPLPSDSPLWKLDNVVLTPHSAGVTPHHFERGLTIFLDNLKRYRAGQPLTNVVDKAAGY
jgi:phosphoglycerate dehydrogenase-like enzyme